MEYVLDEINSSLNFGLWYPTIATLLTIPDTCRAVDYWGKDYKSKARYVIWYDKWVLPKFRPTNVKFDGSVVYIVRNAMLHETTGFTRGKHGFDRIVFMPPVGGRNPMEFCLSRNSGAIQETAFQVTIFGFMNAISAGVREWVADVRADPDTRRLEALDKLIQYLPAGQPPHFVGVPVIS